MTKTIAAVQIKIANKITNIKALEYKTRPQKGHGSNTVLLDGQNHTLTLTKGRGQGTKMMHYAYFTVGSKHYYFNTNDWGLLTANGVEIITLSKMPAADEVVAEAPVVEAAPKAPVKKTGGKRKIPAAATV